MEFRHNCRSARASPLGRHASGRQPLAAPGDGDNAFHRGRKPPKSWPRICINGKHRGSCVRGHDVVMVMRPARNRMAGVVGRQGRVPGFFADVVVRGPYSARHVRRAQERWRGPHDTRVSRWTTSSPQRRREYCDWRWSSGPARSRIICRSGSSGDVNCPLCRDGERHHHRSCARNGRRHIRSRRFSRV